MANVALVALARSSGYCRPVTDLCDAGVSADTVSCTLTTPGGTSLIGATNLRAGFAIGQALIAQGATASSQYEIRDWASNRLYFNGPVSDLLSL